MADKLAVIILSGNENRDRALLGLKFALHTTIGTRVVLFGAAEKLAAEDDEFKGLVKQLIDKNIIPVACVNIADEENIKERLLELKINLKPVGALISDYVKDGYAPITF
ncbi:MULTISPECIES: hypothetical protein [Acidiplasma]|jgi:hypothetical protein|uniref:DsrE family protein n=2 Tax=Acidiplasma cupricumulans TaxID=312540 RepID=A0A0Q0VYD2_9ARCH|nr:MULTISPECIES: hypothetical protein [Acidiplasma]KQB36806.1 hypothetical protein AOG55_03050 [Acidiplasma cupricumulans]